MLDKLKRLASAVGGAAERAAVLVGDLNGDGKVDEQDAHIAAKWAKNAATSLGDEAAALGKTALRSDLAKDAATGAAIGAAVAIPVPIIGPLAGAAIGAGLGVYKNFTKSDSERVVNIEAPKPFRDLHGELLKLAELRDKGIITEAEFMSEKSKALKGDA